MCYFHLVGKLCKLSEPKQTAELYVIVNCSFKYLPKKKRRETNTNYMNLD